MKATDRYHVQGVYCRFEGRTLRVANMSKKGFFAESSSPPPIGETLQCELQVGPTDQIHILAEVAWLNSPVRRSKGLPEGFGVRFVRIKTVDLDAVVDLLRRSDRMLTPWDEPDGERGERGGRT
jgi:hypothetical protein